MSVARLCWLLAGVLAVLSLKTSAITHAPPGPVPFERMLPVLFGGGALFAIGLAAALNLLPRTHRVHQARPLRVGVIATLTTTVVMLLVG
jgi:hypothetical protein